jgi:hypothetical protein
MAIVIPNQYNTLAPFVSRLYNTVNHLSALEFPLLDLNASLPEEDQIADALTRPMPGEVYDGAYDDYTFHPGGVGHNQTEGLIDLTDPFYGDNDLRIFKRSNTELDVTTGRCMVANIFAEITEVSILDITNEDHYKFPSVDYSPADPATIAGKTYVVVASLYGDIDSAEVGLFIVRDVTFHAFRTAVAGVDSMFEKALVMLGAYSVDGSSEIDELYDEIIVSGTTYKRDWLPRGLDISITPLNGGVIRDDGGSPGWFDDWT